MRNVIVASNSSNRPVRISNFTGNTWGELKSHPEVAPLVGSNVEAVVKQGKITLNREDSELPEGDVTIFLVPTKNKAGMTPEAAQSLGQEIADAIQKAAALSSVNQVEELKEELISEIEQFFNVDLTDEVATATATGLSDEDRAIMDELRGFNS